MDTGTMIISSVLMVFIIAYGVMAYRTHQNNKKTQKDLINYDVVKVNQSVLISGALMMVLCALIAVAGIILKRSDYMILGGLLVVACAMQLFVSKEQNIVYVGDHDFIFTGYKFRYKNIDALYPPKGMFKGRYVMKMSNGQTYKIPVKVIEMILPYCKTNVIKTDGK